LKWGKTVLRTKRQVRGPAFRGGKKSQKRGTQFPSASKAQLFRRGKERSPPGARRKKKKKGRTLLLIKVGQILQQREKQYKKGGGLRNLCGD